MKHLFRWLWHGENVGRRFGSALMGVGGIFVALDMLPTDRIGWIRLWAGVGMATVGGLMSRKISDRMNGGK